MCRRSAKGFIPYAGLINPRSKEIRTKSAQRQTAGLKKDPSKGEGVVKQSIHYILDGCYSLSASIPMMKYSKAVLAYDPSDHHVFERKCYRVSMTVLVVYLVLAYLITPHGWLATLNATRGRGEGADALRNSAVLECGATADRGRAAHRPEPEHGRPAVLLGVHLRAGGALHVRCRSVGRVLRLVDFRVQ